MKRLFVMLPFLLLLLAACAPVQERSLSPNPRLMVSEQAEVQSEPMPVEEILPTATKKPKGKNPPVVATSTNPDFFATEITGRPTEKSITVNVVPATTMEIYYEYANHTEDEESQHPGYDPCPQSGDNRTVRNEFARSFFPQFADQRSQGQDHESGNYCRNEKESNQYLSVK